MAPRLGGMTEREFLSLVSCVAEDSPGSIQPLAEAPTHEEFEPDHARLGWEAFSRNEVAYCLFAGGTGSRAGLGTKGLIRIPGLGLTTLAVHLATSTITGWGRVFHPPVWVMTSPSNDRAIREHLAMISGPSLNNVSVFQQFEAFTLDPMGRLARDNDDMPILRPTGTGDLPFALQEHGILSEFILRGGKYVVLSNVDNLQGALDETILGYHIASGKDITCEVVERNEGDRGGGPAWVDGRLQMVEDFRLPADIDPGDCRYLNTNNIIINVKALHGVGGSVFPYHRVRKEHEGQLITQYERLIHQAGDWYDMGVIHVPREVRFMPIKTREDLDAVAQRLMGGPGGNCDG